MTWLGFKKKKRGNSNYLRHLTGKLDVAASRKNYWVAEEERLRKSIRREEAQLQEGYQEMGYEHEPLTPKQHG